LQAYIERSQTVLIYLSSGYFTSKNCMIELRSTVNMRKAIIPVLELDHSRGGLSNQQILTRLLDSDNKWAKWGFVGDGLGEAKGRQLYKALFSYEPIEWNRIGAFQVHQ
jgi:hypothetical protein